MTTDANIFVVATPIGNLSDISERAKKTLELVDVIAAEDTRQTRKLLQLLGIQNKKIISYHDHQEEKRAQELIKELLAKKQKLALVSDAGTPCVSDPGYRLIKLARCHGIPVHPVPGPSSILALVSVSGLPSDRFTFVGFLPTGEKKIAAEVSSWRQGARSVIFLVPPRRLLEALQIIKNIYPQAEGVVGRELTKLHEEIAHGTMDELIKWASSHNELRGEAAVMIYLGEVEEPEVALPDIRKLIRSKLREGLSLKSILQDLKTCGLPRKELYHLILTEQDKR